MMKATTSHIWSPKFCPFPARPEPNQRSISAGHYYNHLGFSSSPVAEAHEALKVVESGAVEVLIYTTKIVAGELCGSGDFERALQVLDEMCETAVMPNVGRICYLVIGCLNAGDIERAEEALRKVGVNVKGLVAGVCLYTTMIKWVL